MFFQGLEKTELNIRRVGVVFHSVTARLVKKKPRPRHFGNGRCFCLTASIGNWNLDWKFHVTKATEAAGVDASSPDGDVKLLSHLFVCTSQASVCRFLSSQLLMTDHKTFAERSMFPRGDPSLDVSRLSSGTPTFR